MKRFKIFGGARNQSESENDTSQRASDATAGAADEAVASRPFPSPQAEAAKYVFCANCREFVGSYCPDLLEASCPLGNA